MAFPGNMPITPGHILLCPVRHVSKSDELTDSEVIAIKNFLTTLKHTLRKTLDVKGFNVAWNEGGIAGQTVNHLHIHIVPRKEDDSGICEYEPRKFLYRPGERNITPEKELKDVAMMIKKELNTQ